MLSPSASAHCVNERSILTACTTVWGALFPHKIASGRIYQILVTWHCGPVRPYQYNLERVAEPACWEKGARPILQSSGPIASLQFSPLRTATHPTTRKLDLRMLLFRREELCGVNFVATTIAPDLQNRSLEQFGISYSRRAP